MTHPFLDGLFVERHFLARLAMPKLHQGPPVVETNLPPAVRAAIRALDEALAWLVGPESGIVNAPQLTQISGAVTVAIDRLQDALTAHLVRDRLREQLASRGIAIGGPGGSGAGGQGPELPCNVQR